MRHGSGWLQGTVVRDLPRSYPFRIQRIHQQLVERAQRAPPTRFPQV